MKLKMYMYDRDIVLEEEAAMLFLEQLDSARESMKTLLDVFEEEPTRVAMFYMMSLRSYIDDFLEFCAEDITVEEMEMLLNQSRIDFDEEDEEFEEEDEDEFEIYVDFNEDEEE